MSTIVVPEDLRRHLGEHLISADINVYQSHSQYSSRGLANQAPVKHVRTTPWEH